MFTGIDIDLLEKYDFESDSLMSLKKKFSDEIFLEIRENT